MTTFANLQAAVLDKNIPEAQSLIAQMDKRTAADVFQKAAKQFGFRTIDYNGCRFAMRSEVSTAFGYAGESGLRHVCRRYNIDAVPLGDFVKNGRTRISEELGLSRKDYKSTFIGWEAFLLASLEIKSAKARAVCAYLMKMERAARLSSQPVEVAKPKRFNPDKLAEVDKIIDMFCLLDGIQNGVLRQRAAETLDDALGGTLGVIMQPNLAFAAQEI